MESFAKLVSALSSLAWPAIFGILLYKFYQPLKSLIESARGRKFTIKVAGNELTMEELPISSDTFTMISNLS